MLIVCCSSINVCLGLGIQHGCLIGIVAQWFVVGIWYPFDVLFQSMDCLLMCFVPVFKSLILYDLVLLPSRYKLFVFFFHKN